MLTDDELSTLEAALAFIDNNYDPTAEVSLPVLPADDPLSTSTSDGDSPTTRPVISPAKDTIKRARKCQAAARSNRKKRAELLQLRELAASLATRRDALHIATMRGRRFITKAPNAMVASRRGDSLMRVADDIATVEAQRLNDSRALNSRLRAALDQQRGVGAALIKVLKQRLDFKCLQDLLQETSVTTNTLHVASPPSATMSTDRRALFRDLHTRLKAFSVEANSVLAVAKRETVLAESRTSVLHHPVHGPVIELVSSTQIPCDLEAGWTYMMSAYCKALPTMNRRDFAYRAQARGCRRVPIDGVGLFESFESCGWKMFIWATVVSIRRDGTRVRERGWTAMTRSRTGHCVLHIRHELFTTTATRGCPKTAFLVESLLKKARQDHRNVETTMAERFGADAFCDAALVTNM